MTVEIDHPYAVSGYQIACFQRDGFVRLKNVFDAETLAHYGREITKLTIDLNTQALLLEDRTTYEKAFLQVPNLWEHSEIAREFTMGRRLAGIASALLQVEGVRLYHDQSLYKEPGGGITPAHADQYYWPLDSDRTVTAWVPLQPVPKDMGPLDFFAGSHHVEFGRDLDISDQSECEITREMEARGLAVVSAPFDLGEVSFHLGWTFHRAGENRSNRPRSVMTVIYMDRDMRLIAPTNSHQVFDWERWCPGAIPGEIINTKMNPVLFERAL